MDVNVVDKSGEPRSVQSAKEALACVDKHIIKAQISSGFPIDLFLVLPTIHEILKSYISMNSK